MKTRATLLTILVVCGALLSASCGGPGGPIGAIPGSGNIQTETRDTGPFEAITIDYPADVTIQAGAAEAVEIRADDNVLPQITTEVTSGRLTIRTPESDRKSRVNPSEPVKITVMVKDLKEIDFAAPFGTVQANGLQADTFKLVLRGGAKITLDGLQVEFLDGVLSGAGDIEISGAATEIKLLHSGLGNFNAGNLQSRKATVELSGMGGATVRVAEELAATVTGAGAVKYYGQPRVEKNVSGAGSVEPAG